MGRVLALGGVALAVTVGGHVAAAGSVSLLGIAVVGILMLLVAVFATAGELSGRSLFAFIGSAQVGAHFLFGHLGAHGSHGASSAALGAVPGSDGATTGAALATHAHGSVGQATEATAALGTTLVGAASAVLSAAPMVLMHAAVALVMALILRAGERTYFNLHRLLPSLLALLLGLFSRRIPLARPAHSHARLTVLGRRSQPTVQSLLIGHDIARRGPPLGLAVS